MARIAYFTTEDLVAAADVVVEGTVVSSDGYWTGNAKIHTEVVVHIGESIKGGFNKQSNVAFTVPGGTVGIAVMRASEMPSFSVGDEVVIWLHQRADGSFGVQAGERGVVRVTSGKSGGGKYVTGASAAAQKALAEDGRAMDEDEKADEESATAGPITLEDYLDYLRGIVRKLKRAGR